MTRSMLPLAAATLALTLIALITPSGSNAKTSPIDVSNDNITCNTIFGVVKFNPPFVNGGTATTPKLTVKGIVDGCTDNTNGAVLILQSKFVGTLTGTSNDCLSLATTTPVTGTLTFKWKAAKTTPIAQTSTTMTVSSITGGTFAPGGSFGVSYAEFSIGSSGSDGAFTGGDGGATSTNTIVTSQDITTILTGCGGAGIKTVNLGLGTITLK